MDPLEVKIEDKNLYMCPITVKYKNIYNMGTVQYKNNLGFGPFKGQIQEKCRV